MSSVYTIEERVFIIKSYYAGNSLRRVRDMFSMQFEGRPIPSIATIQLYVQTLENTGYCLVENGRLFEYLL